MLDVDILKNEFGIDARAGLQRCMNNQKFFNKMLNMALKNPAFDKLEVALANNNLEESFELCHALKGVVGNLALDKLYNPISDITESLRAKKDLDYVTLYKPVKTLRDNLVAKL